MTEFVLLNSLRDLRRESRESWLHGSETDAQLFLFFSSMCVRLCGRHLSPLLSYSQTYLPLINVQGDTDIQGKLSLYSLAKLQSHLDHRTHLQPFFSLDSSNSRFVKKSNSVYQPKWKEKNENKTHFMNDWDLWDVVCWGIWFFLLMQKFKDTIYHKLQHICWCQHPVLSHHPYLSDYEMVGRDSIHAVIGGACVCGAWACSCLADFTCWV